jgi:hypothetical protein
VRQCGSYFAHLPLYSPDLNPIRNWSYYRDDPGQEFGSFLEWCINRVGAKADSARGYFQHGGLTIGDWNNSHLGNSY